MSAFFFLAAANVVPEIRKHFAALRCVAVSCLDVCSACTQGLVPVSYSEFCRRCLLSVLQGGRPEGAASVQLLRHGAVPDVCCMGGGRLRAACCLTQRWVRKFKAAGSA